MNRHCWRSNTNPAQSTRFDLRPDENNGNRFVHSLRADSPFRYRVSAGDDRTEWHHVSVVDYPSFEFVHFTITPPNYVDRPRYERTLIPSRVRVVQGSRLELKMKPLSKLTRLELQLSSLADDSVDERETVTLTPDFRRLVSVHHAIAQRPDPRTVP